MDTNWRPQPQGVAGEPAMESGDWRAQLQSDSRQRIVNKIMETLKRHLPFSGQEGLLELKKIAVRFEEKIYSAATSQSDYLRKISLKMLTMETKSQNPIPNNPNGNRPAEPGPQMQSQVNNQGHASSIPLATNQSQPRQQLLPQNIQNNIASNGIQVSGSLPSALPQVSNLNQSSMTNANVQNSNMQNLSGVTQNSVGNSIVPGMTSNMLANSQRQMQPRQSGVPQQQQQQSQNPQQYLYHQQLQQQQQQQQLLKQKFQQQQNLLQPTQLQSSQQSGLSTSSLSGLQQSTQSMLQQQPTVLRQAQQPQQMPQQQVMSSQQQQLMGQQSNSINMPQTQLIGQQNSVGDMQQQQQQRLLGQQNNIPNLQQQQQLMAQQNNISNMHQQHIVPQSNVSGLQQQQLLGTQSGNSNMQPNQHSVHMPKVSLQQQSASSMSTQGLQSQNQSQQHQLMSHMQSQPTQFQQHPNSLQRDMQQRMQASGSLLQPQNIIDQQKQLYQSQRNLPETSSNSTSQTGQANGGDWQEEVYQKIKTMKEMYLPELNEMYQKIATKLQQHDSLPQQPRSEQLDKLKVFKAMLERIITFLQVSKSNILPGFKEKLGQYEKQIINFINTNRPRKPAPTMQPMQQQQTQSQIKQVQSHDNQMNPQLQAMNLQGSVPTMQQNNMTNLQHSSLSSLAGATVAQPNMTSSLQPSSNLDSAQGNALSSLQQVTGSLQQTPLNAPQQANMNNLSSQNGANVLQQNINPVQSSSNLLQHQQMLQKQQFQQRQMQQQQMLQKQQQLHQQQQAKPQLSSQLQTHQMQQLHQMREGMSVKPGVFQQHHSSGQRSAYTHQQLKPGAPFPISSPQLLQSPSPQMQQHSSPQIDQQNLLTSLTKAGTPLQSASSPFVVPSPSTSLAPSPMPCDTEKPVVSSLSDVGHQQATSAVAPASSLAIGTPGISASPLLAEFTGTDGTHGNALTIISGKSGAIEQPLQRLLKAVKSMSSTTLNASVSDIGSVVSMIDRIAGSAPGNGSRAAVGEELVAMTKCRQQARNFMTQDGTSGTRKMRRYTSAVPINVVSSVGSINDSFKQFTGSEMSDLESTATSSVKRPRLEANHALLEEIREINQRLIDTVVDISEECVDPTAAAAAAEGGEGTIVKCSFSAVALGPNLKSQYASAQMSPIQPLRLLVPTNYPNCSPVLIDKLPVEISKDHEDLSVKAKSRFSISLRSLSQPVSLGEIVRTWDVCARAVISEHAQQRGGGSFSSKYGTWENCLSAA